MVSSHHDIRNYMVGVQFFFNKYMIIMQLKFAYTGEGDVGL